MATVLSQDDINQLLTAINAGESDASNDAFDEALDSIEKYLTANIASGQFHKKARHFFGSIYNHGAGRNMEKAKYWFTKAAEQGDADAQNKLGLMYEEGKGVPKDESKAAEWFAKAAKQRDADAQQFKFAANVIMPAGATSIGNFAFQGCSFTSITIPAGVTSIGEDAFGDCENLLSVTIPSSVTSIGANAFKGCKKLTSITISADVTFVGDSAFSDTAWFNNQPDGLIYVGKVLYAYKGPMPANTAINNIRADTVAIAEGAFWGCRSLTSVAIPASVTSIGERAFCDCRRLASITIPSSVTSVGDDAFSDCNALAPAISADIRKRFGDGPFHEINAEWAFKRLSNLAEQRRIKRMKTLIGQVFTLENGSSYLAAFMRQVGDKYLYLLVTIDEPLKMIVGDVQYKNEKSSMGKYTGSDYDEILNGFLSNVLNNQQHIRNNL